MGRAERDAFLKAFGSERVAVGSDSLALPCGLQFSSESLSILPSDHYYLRALPLLEEAHQVHHRQHYGTPASLYLVSDGAELTGALCSCIYEQENPERFTDLSLGRLPSA
jgi:hypothetical protein